MRQPPAFLFNSLILGLFRDPPFPAPWSVERIEGAFKVLDETGQALAYVYFRTSAENADAAKALTPDEARR